MVYVKIQTSEKSNGNKGSSRALASYLEKEDLQNEKEAIENGELSTRKGFFNHSEDRIYREEVISAIDNNKKGLGKNDSKFYAITISLSEKEQQHVLSSITDKPIQSLSELNSKELETYENSLKDYTNKVMNEYAQNFNRQNKGLHTGKNLVYFGKIEHQRSYKGTDAEVKNGMKKSGEIKEGLNTHVHIIVARKDKEQKLKLSPLATEKGRNNNSKLNGKSVQRGFDRNLFSLKAERTFDKAFNYKRQLTDTIEYKIESQKNIELKTREKLTTSSERKEVLQKQLIDSFYERNGYDKLNKEQQKSNDYGLEI